MEKVLSWRDTKPHYDPLGGSQEDKYPDSTLFSLLLLLLQLLSGSVEADPVPRHRWQPTRLPCPWDSPGNQRVSCG